MTEYLHTKEAVMISFQKYFENRVEELIRNSGNQTFFVFRGFEIEQIQYLVSHPNSILNDTTLLRDGFLDLSIVENSKKKMNRKLLLTEESVIGFYEELIALLSVVKDLSASFDGKVVIVNNNLFSNAIPSCLSYNQASDFFDYMQSDKNYERPAMELIGQYYSDALVLNDENVLLYPNNVHRDLNLEIINFFETNSYVVGEYNDGDEILVGTDKDYLYRLAIMRDQIKYTNIKKDKSDGKGDADSLQTVLECLRIPYSITEVDLKAPEFEYDDSQFQPYLKKYWGPNAEFRQLEFYCDPSTSKEIKVYSQGSLVSEIVEQCELAQDGEDFRDIFITAPTGAGKSLLFQLPAIYISEKYDLVTIVISPLIALMNDQVAQLENERGVKIATCINSSISYEARQQRIEEIRSGKKSVVYLAPELLLATGLQTLLGERKIGLLVIDEAHTVTSWGRDFRSDYWFLGDFLKSVKKNGYRFPVLCLTATAVYTGVDDVVNDTIAELDLNNPILHLGNVKRKNIKFDIVCHEKGEYGEKLETIKKNIILGKVRECVEKREKILAYCPYRIHVDSIYNELSPDETKVIRRYYGQLRKQEKNITEKEYRNGQILALICTKAFGMGVDRSDIKHIVHFAPTGSLSDYVQEIGRAARDESIVGVAHMDFFAGDMRYVRSLHGISEMNQFQLKSILKKIVDIYQSKKHRNMLIAPDSFSHLFKEKELDAKVKNGLLMIAKDLKAKYGFPVIIVRPRVMLTRIFVSVPDSLQRMFDEKIGEYSKRIGRMPDRFIPNADGTETRVILPGTVYSVRIGELWENQYSNLSFGAFKQLVFDPEFMQDDKGAHLTPRIQVNVTYHKAYDEVKKQVEDLLEAIVSVLVVHKRAEKKSFEEREFVAELNERLSVNTLDRNQIGMLLDMMTIEVNENAVFQQNKSLYKIIQKRKQQKNPEMAEYIIMGNYARLKGSMMRLLSQCYPGEDMQYHAYLPYAQDKTISIMPILKLLEIIDLASYDLKGGENAEIFLRVNDPEKIKRLAYSNYQNEVLKEIKRKHRDSQELLKQFFTCPMGDEKRWDFIESYFLGREEELETYLMESSGNC